MHSLGREVRHWLCEYKVGEHHSGYGTDRWQNKVHCFYMLRITSAFSPGAVMGASALMEGVMAAKGSMASGTAGSSLAGSWGGPCCSLRPWVKPWKEWVWAC